MFCSPTSVAERADGNLSTILAILIRRRAIVELAGTLRDSYGVSIVTRCFCRLFDDRNRGRRRVLPAYLINDCIV